MIVLISRLENSTDSTVLAYFTQFKENNSINKVSKKRTIRTTTKAWEIQLI